MKKIFSLDSMGDFEIEQELVSLDYPLLCVAICGSSRFLVETLDYEKGLFLASSITESRLLDMLSGKKDMYSTMLAGNRILNIKYDYSLRKYVSDLMEKNNIDDEDLPDKGIFIELTDELLTYKHKECPLKEYKEQADENDETKTNSLAKKVADLNHYLPQ